MYYLKTYTDIFNSFITLSSYKIIIIVIYCRQLSLSSLYNKLVAMYQKYYANNTIKKRRDRTFLSQLQFKFVSELKKKKIILTSEVFFLNLVDIKIKLKKCIL